ncbi:hypothetical protein POM88_024853 [Heracleum sosnowskyi]|uniref:F-box domain-containing protein n=1 Tax=Heracleum sosnowskyi TaxID=360622 RepID=A0AAD8MML9_9APIA|nr:hypothetical protein POM88_024853 [Heracleum sosnowskyi]
MEDRKWEDMPTDCLVNIFETLEVESKLLCIPAVCKHWYQAVKDPLCWKDLDDFVVHDIHTYPKRAQLMKLVLDLGQTCVTHLTLWDNVTIEELIYLSEAFPAVKTLYLPSQLSLDYYGDSSSSNAPVNANRDDVDEGEMRMAYHEAAMEMQFPEDAPPLTQPSQTIEKMRRATIKKEQASKIDAMKAQPNSPRRSSRLNNMTSQVIVDGGQMHNSYTGAMRLGPPPPPPIKQYKTNVGCTTLKSAPFQSHEKTVITKGTLQTTSRLHVRRKIDGKK